MDAAIKSNAKLKNLTPSQQEMLWAWRHPEDGSEDRVQSFSQILAMLPEAFGITSSLAALSEFYSWLTQKREMDDAIARAEQAKLEYLKLNPDASPEALQDLGQLVFTNKSIREGDLSGFVKITSAWERREKRKLERDKLTEASKSKIQVAMDALLAEIKGNPRAEAAFLEFQKTLPES